MYEYRVTPRDGESNGQSGGIRDCELLIANNTTTNRPEVLQPFD